ncbi:hypothetical protein Syun_004407 [Stephania yunnanensis]|uniref:Uncharacterized protein n=1 Tax=Stephania yunnanensis TaxID=152371 RepID=A0AAP0L3X3_9MAGN
MDLEWRLLGFAKIRETERVGDEEKQRLMVEEVREARRAKTPNPIFSLFWSTMNLTRRSERREYRGETTKGFGRRRWDLGISVYVDMIANPDVANVFRARAKAKLQRRRQELTQTTPNQPVDDEAVYYKVASECPKGRVYSLRSLGRKKRRCVDPDASTSQVLAQRGMGNFMILRDVSTPKELLEGVQAMEQVLLLFLVLEVSEN